MDIVSDRDPPNRFGGVFLPLQQLRYVSLVDSASVLPAKPADATHCWLAFLTLTLAHCPKIVFGVLEVILCHDPIPPQCFGVGKGQIAFIASMEVLNITRLVADESGRLISVGGLRSSQHGVGDDFRTLARLPGEHSPSLRWAHHANILRDLRER
jgi:hypothetical protein